MQYQLFTIIASLAAQIYSQSYAINNPIKGTVWKAGDNVKIGWVKAGGSGGASTVSLDLVTGDSNNLKVVESIGANIPADSGSFNWQAPSTLPAGGDYSVRITAGGSDVNYSHAFVLEGGSPTASNKTTSATATSTTKKSTATPTNKKNGTSSDNKNNNSSNDASEVMMNLQFVAFAIATAMACYAF
ncbi:hypothetical protein MIR68_005823 [Amoeboaphelidium protococcarum]|nr:hypothetical protein MIR68_005823 [Amoeboaphelidium protococcarum]